jgi:hypothetical protein
MREGRIQTNLIEKEGPDASGRNRRGLKEKCERRECGTMSVFASRKKLRDSAGNLRTRWPLLSFKNAAVGSPSARPSGAIVLGTALQLFGFGERHEWHCQALLSQRTLQN